MRLPDRDLSRAVLIGVGTYEHLPDLTGVHAGAQELHAVLTDPDHGPLHPEHCVLVPEDASTVDVGDAIAAAAGEAEDLLLIYFAGHGIRGRRRGDLHLAMTGTREERVEFTGIAWDFVRDYVLHSNARLKVNILDCCFSGRARGLTMSAGTDVLAAVGIEGSATMTSVPPNHQAIILPGEEYPAYTKRLLDLLRTGIAGEAELLSLPRLHHHLLARLRAAGLRQPEAEWVALIDQLGLVRNRAWHQPMSAPPAPQAAPLPPAQPTPELPAQPTPSPAARLSAVPVPPTEERAPRPPTQPPAEPTQRPTPQGTRPPTPEPLAEPTHPPTAEPLAEPSVQPVPEPSAGSTPQPTAASRSGHAEAKPSGDAPTRIERDVTSPDPAVRAQAYRAAIDLVGGQLGAATERARDTTPPPLPPTSLWQRISEVGGPYLFGVVIGLVGPMAFLDLFTPTDRTNKPDGFVPGLIVYVVLAVVIVLAERFVPGNRRLAMGFGIAASSATFFAFDLDFVAVVLGMGLPFLYFMAVKLVLPRMLR